MLPRNERRMALRHLERQNATFPTHIVQLPESSWPSGYRPPNIREVWRSREFLVQVFDQGPGVTRLSVCKTAWNEKRDRWADGISWEDLQRIKRECGRGGLDAAEAYPRDSDVVNVANMRHLFVFNEPLSWLWREGGEHA
ncbi:MAG TPA: hypothetical protein VFW60_09625 [Rhodanobacteraceae bacterium]|nr:hypothetical protein [Rhodanobacteraceae bacterium]